MTNTTVSDKAGAPVGIGVIIGGSIGGVTILLALAGCILYCKRKSDRNRNDHVMGTRSSSYVALELPETAYSGSRVVDPLEKRPYTKLSLPYRDKTRSKYGVCQYRTKGESHHKLSDKTSKPKAKQESSTKDAKSKEETNYSRTQSVDKEYDIEFQQLPSYDLVIASDNDLQK